MLNEIIYSVRKVSPRALVSELQRPTFWRSLLCL